MSLLVVSIGIFIQLSLLYFFKPLKYFSLHYLSSKSSWNKKLKEIIFSIISSGLLFGVMIFFVQKISGFTLNPSVNFSFLEFLETAILTPLNEELMIRFYFLGVFVHELFHFIPLIIKRKEEIPKKKFQKPVMNIHTAIILQAAYFFILHSNTHIISIFRFLTGILWGYIYIKTDYNLTATITGHMTWNTLALLFVP